MLKFYCIKLVLDMFLFQSKRLQLQPLDHHFVSKMQLFSQSFHLYINAEFTLSVALILNLGIHINIAHITNAQRNSIFSRKFHITHNQSQVISLKPLSGNTNPPQTSRLFSHFRSQTVSCFHKLFGFRSEPFGDTQRRFGSKYTQTAPYVRY